MAFEEIEITAGNSIERAIQRILIQFRKSPVLIDLLAAFVNEVQVLLDATIQVIKMRGPANAAGEQLDGIGRIVGQLRTVINFDTIAWFIPDRLYQGSDQAPAWVKNAPLANNVEADDAWFRQLIEAKVSRNFIRWASVPEIQQFCQYAFGIDVSIRRIDHMTIQIIIPDDTGLNTMNAMNQFVSNDLAESTYLLPFAAGVYVSSVLRLSETIDDSSGS